MGELVGTIPQHQQDTREQLIALSISEVSGLGVAPETMTAFATPEASASETQETYIGATAITAGPVETQESAHNSVLDRLRGTAVGKFLTRTAVVLAGIGGGSAIAGSTAGEALAAQGHHRHGQHSGRAHGAGHHSSLMSPDQMAFDAIHYYDDEINNSGTNLRGKPKKLELKPHLFLEATNCPPNRTDVNQLLRFNQKGAYSESCTKVNGKFQSYMVKHRYIYYPPAAKAVDLMPPLEQIGDVAAQSAGIDQHGTPAAVKIIWGKRATTAYLKYKEDSALMQSGQQDLKGLQISVSNKTKKVTAKSPTWY